MKLSVRHRQMPSAVSLGRAGGLQRPVMACKLVQLRSTAVSLDQATICEVLISDTDGLWESHTVAGHSFNSDTATLWQSHVITWHSIKVVTRLDARF